MTITVKNKDNTEVITGVKLALLDLTSLSTYNSDLWEKYVGYIAQNLAEKHSTSSGELFRLRALLTKILGMDPETHTFLPDAPLKCLSLRALIPAIVSVLYVNNTDWQKALTSVIDTMTALENDINIEEYVSPHPESMAFIQKLSESIKVVGYTKLFLKNPENLVKEMGLAEYIHKSYNVNDYTNNFVNITDPLIQIAKEYGTCCDRTIVLTMNPHDEETILYTLLRPVLVKDYAFNTLEILKEPE